MRQVRFGPVGQERPGILDNDGLVRDASSLTGSTLEISAGLDYFEVLRSSLSLAAILAANWASVSLGRDPNSRTWVLPA